MVFAPHVETASGMILPDAYLRAVADAVHAVGGLFVLDCIASGTIWVDMAANGVDILISAPQKGWSASPCCALVMLSERARAAIDATTSTSFACDLRKWLQIMEAYENGGHAYHATMPTDALIRLRDAMKETEALRLRAAFARSSRSWATRCARCWRETAIRSVAAEGFEAPGVVVSYTEDPEIQSGKKFLATGPADRGRRSAAMRRARRFPDVSHRAVRPGQAAQRRPHGCVPRCGAVQDPAGRNALQPRRVAPDWRRLWCTRLLRRSPAGAPARIETGA